jgi:hypothetical protein
VRCSARRTAVSQKSVHSDSQYAQARAKIFGGAEMRFKADIATASARNGSCAKKWLAYRWFCRLGLDGAAMPDHSTSSLRSSGDCHGEVAE